MYIDENFLTKDRTLITINKEKTNINKNNKLGTLNYVQKDNELYLTTSNDLYKILCVDSNGNIPAASISNLNVINKTETSFEAANLNNLNELFLNSTTKTIFKIGTNELFLSINKDNNNMSFYNNDKKLLDISNNAISAATGVFDNFNINSKLKSNIIECTNANVSTIKSNEAIINNISSETINSSDILVKNNITTSTLKVTNNLNSNKIYSDEAFVDKLNIKDSIINVENNVLSIKNSSGGDVDLKCNNLILNKVIDIKSIPYKIDHDYLELNNNTVTGEAYITVNNENHPKLLWNNINKTWKIGFNDNLYEVLTSNKAILSNYLSLKNGESKGLVFDNNFDNAKIWMDDKNNLRIDSSLNPLYTGLSTEKNNIANIKYTDILLNRINKLKINNYDVLTEEHINNDIINNLNNNIYISSLNGKINKIIVDKDNKKDSIDIKKNGVLFISEDSKNIYLCLNNEWMKLCSINNKQCCGENNFKGLGQKITIPHNFGTKPNTVNITPIENTEGKVGDIWVEYDNNNIYVGNTGVWTGKFSWSAI